MRQSQSRSRNTGIASDIRRVRLVIFHTDYPWFSDSEDFSNSGFNNRALEYIHPSFNRAGAPVSPTGIDWGSDRRVASPKG